MTDEVLWYSSLTSHHPLVPHICVSESGQRRFRYWLVAYWASRHYLNQCWVIVSLPFRNRLQWKFHRNTKLLIHQNASENIICEMAAILSRGRWIKIPLQIVDRTCTLKFLPLWIHNGLWYCGVGTHLFCWLNISTAQFVFFALQ